MQQKRIARVEPNAAETLSARLSTVDDANGPFDRLVKAMAEQMPSPSEYRSFRRLLVDLSKHGGAYRDYQIHPSLADE